jgi:ABC-type uncharacterized transport system involved in gliding motility auxiliary subunit
MKSSKSQTLLYSSVGVLLVFIAIVGVNLIFGAVRARVDLTSDHLHTLSDGTKKILGKLDSPVEVRLYASRSENRMPSSARNYVQNVEDLLGELQAQSHGNLKVKKFDPEPDSEAEDAAKLDGVEPITSLGREPFYLGLVVSQDPQKVPIPFLDPNREKLLEYDLARAIAQVSATNKPVVGIMSPLQVFGMRMPPQMMARMGQQGSDPWMMVNELKRDFQVEQVGMDVDAIDEKIKVLLVIHPKDISDKAQYAIDQFVMRGGTLVAFVDPLCLVDNRNPNSMGLNLGGGSSLPKLFKAWGMEFDPAKVVADPTFMRELRGPDGRPQVVPSFLFLNSEAINRDDVLTSQTDDVWLPFAGAFTGTPAEGLKSDVLLKSSKQAQLVDGVTAQFNGQKTIDELKPAGVNYSLGMRLTGKFKTAFPDGKPGGDAKDADAKDGDKPEADKTATKASKDSLKESKANGIVFLFGDADMLADQFTVQINRMFRIAEPLNGNLALVQSLVEQASGDASLVGARSRASLRRPFTVVQKIETEARMKWQSELERLQKKQDEAQQKLSEIKVKQDGNTAKIILTPEQQAALETFQKQQVSARTELKKVKRSLREDVESLENKLKWLNIALVPLLVSVAGVGLAVARHRRHGAK